MDRVYWASEPEKKIADCILEKVKDYKDYLVASGYISELRKSYSTFFGSSSIQNVDQSLKAIHVNHFGNLVRHVHVMVTSQRPAWEPRAINSDHESQAACSLASGLLDFYMREKQIEKKLNESVKRSLYLREGWLSLDWNATGGEIYGVNEENGEPIHEGDVEVNIHTILDVIRDYKKKDMNHDWYIIRTLKNKWDIAAKWPELAEKITAIDSVDKSDIEYEFNVSKVGSKIDEKSSDLIYVYTLYHAKTDAIPAGRMVQIIDSDVVLFDGPLPYKRPYIIPIIPSHYTEQAFGHSELMDLLPLQDAMNMTVSSILTNQAANAIQNFMVPKGAAPKVTNIMDGLNIWEYDPKAGPMQSMDLLKTAPEVFNFAQMLQSQMELISGVSQITRGNAPATMSGTAMALLQQQALEFSSGVQLSYTLALEQLGTALIELLQTFAVVPRIAQISGKMKKSFIKEFSGKDLKGISKVIVDQANPLTKTIAGRVEIANNMLQAGMIKTPEQFLGVYTTGNLEPLYEHDQSQRMLIKSENEELIAGQPVQAIMTDDDTIHVLEHSCILNTSDARKNPMILQNALAHIQEHINNFNTKDPILAQMLKQAAAQTGQIQPVENAGQVMQTSQPVEASIPEPAQPPQI